MLVCLHLCEYTCVLFLSAGLLNGGCGFELRNVGRMGWRKKTWPACGEKLKQNQLLGKRNPTFLAQANHVSGQSDAHGKDNLVYHVALAS